MMEKRNWEAQEVMENTNHRYTQRRPALRRRIACVLCWILLFQGYPLLALRESGGGFYLRDLSAV
ncbi:MAG: hypothetical protein GY856_35525, partial [bacterium]|nr:hypothetical protein [bacterium]